MSVGDGRSAAEADLAAAGGAGAGGGAARAAEAVAGLIVAGLRELADPVRAEGEARYLKSTREHLGVRVPDVRRIVRAVARERGVVARGDVLAVATALWPAGGDGAADDRRDGPGDRWDGPDEVHEHCLAAVELLVARAGTLVAGDLPAVERWLRASGTWALVDALAEKVAGDVVERDPAAAAVLDRWAADPDFWIRRSALLALMPPLKDGAGDWERFRRYADSMVDEREFFVRKAIGWVLRETGKRRPELVAAWLAEHGDRVPGLVRREATKYLAGGVAQKERPGAP